jgi:hypothetical protein
MSDSPTLACCCRYDFSHCADGIGLLLLTAVSFAQYASKQDEKIKKELDSHHHLSPVTPGVSSERTLSPDVEKVERRNDEPSGGFGKRFRNRVGGSFISEMDVIRPCGSNDSEEAEGELNPDLTLNLLQSIEEGESEILSPQGSKEGLNRYPDMYIPTDVNLPSDPEFPNRSRDSTGRRSDPASGSSSVGPTVPPSPSKYIYHSSKNPTEFQVKPPRHAIFFPIDGELPSLSASKSPAGTQVSHRSFGHGSPSPRTWSTSTPISAVADPSIRSPADGGSGSLWQYVAGINDAFESSRRVRSGKKLTPLNSVGNSVVNSNNPSPRNSTHKHYR